jgi:hypothetical protein
MVTLKALQRRVREGGGHAANGTFDLRQKKRESRLAGGGFRTLGSLVAGDGFEPTTFGL